MPAIIPVNVQGEVMWAYLDTGSTKNFVSRDAVKKLNLKPERHEQREIVTLNGLTKQSMPIYKIKINALSGEAQEEIEVTGSKLPDFTTVRRPNIPDLKLSHEHMKDKLFYYTEDGKCQIHFILGDKTFSRIRTENVCKGGEGDPIVEETSFGWVVHGGDYYSDDKCMFTRDTSDCEKLFSLDVLGVEDRGDTNSEILNEFKENITRRDDGRYQITFPWISGRKPTDTNEQQSRKRLQYVNRKLDKTPELKQEYDDIVNQQLSAGVVENAPEIPTGDRVYYMPHKPVVRQKATTTKVRMVFDASAKPNATSDSINDCMFTGPPLQPHLWDILVRTRLMQNLVLADIQKAFLQIEVREEDRDSFRFLYNVNGIENHLRFTRVPFGAEASPFILGVTLQHHLENQPSEYEDTIDSLKENTYVDNLLHGGDDVASLAKFKEEASDILESGKFPVHKWESNVEWLESNDMENPTKLLGHVWDKREESLEVIVPNYPEHEPITKRSILSHLGSIYDPLGVISPTLAEGKRIYRDVCNEKKCWNAEVQPQLKYQWLKWTKQLRNVKVPRSINKSIRRVKLVHLHIFADASTLACCAAAIAVVEGDTGVVQGLLASKSRISKRDTSIPRLELVSGHMAANMARNLCNALRGWPINGVTVWMDSLVALFWINNSGKPWKVFVANRVKKIAQITDEVNITWKYCPTKMNLADLGSRGASIDKLHNQEWFTGPEWLLSKENWPEQPELKKNQATHQEYKVTETVFLCEEKEADEWDELLDRSTYWRTLRVTAWILRFVSNCRLKAKKSQRTKGPLTTEEIVDARDKWVRRVQSNDVPESLQSPGWKLIEDTTNGVLKCEGRIAGYQPTYLREGTFVNKLIAHVHNEMHLGVASTMSSIRENWWIPQLRSKVKKVIGNCNVCKVFSAKPFKAPATSQQPEFRTTPGRPFETTGVDFAGPLIYKVTKKEEGKCYVIIFTCATSRAVHLELAKSQTASEFQEKLNSFITRKTRPSRIVSDNATTFIATSKWIKQIRKSERLHDYLATQNIHWKFNLAKSPWWGGLYERLIKEIKTTLYKTLGKSHLLFNQLETVILDIERHLNNRPLTYVESNQEEEQVLTPNTILWGQNSYALGEVNEQEDDDGVVGALHKRLTLARQHAWTRWQREYVHGLMEYHRMNKTISPVPEMGEIVLIVGEEKNRGRWMKGKVVKHVKGKDGVIRGVVVLHKGNYLERPVQLVCPLEIRSTVKEDQETYNACNKENEHKTKKKQERKSAAIAKEKIKEQSKDD